jgi:hypothetical protein
MTNFLSSDPHFDDETKLMFGQLISRSICYLEFGSGGSTIYALKKTNVAHVYSVESDALFLEEIQNVLTEIERSRLTNVHIDIGETGSCGFPVDESGIHNYWSYPSTVWGMIADQSHHPDLILIDGRFRVACFLISLLHARANTTIIFDDFYDRDHYHLVQRFLEPTQRVGRAAIFRTNEHLKIDTKILDQIVRHICDPR